MMGFVPNRARLAIQYLSEAIGHGFAESEGPQDADVLICLDGVGGWLLGPLLVRRALRHAGIHIRTIIYDWHRGPRAEVFADLMCLRRNRLEAARLARLIKALRRENPARKIHLLGFSGGAGVAVFALERLSCTGRRDFSPQARGLNRGGDPRVDAAVLLCPALSPGYNLGPALRNVRRCYAGVSRKDFVFLGWLTGIFGTIDRLRGPAAGHVGFRRPDYLTPEDEAAYERLHQIHWTPAMKRDGHGGGHMAWADVRFLRKNLPAILEDEVELTSTRC